MCKGPGEWGDRKGLGGRVWCGIVLLRVLASSRENDRQASQSDRRASRAGSSSSGGAAGVVYRSRAVRALEGGRCVSVVVAEASSAATFRTFDATIDGRG